MCVSADVIAAATCRFPARRHRKRNDCDTASMSRDFTAVPPASMPAVGVTEATWKSSGSTVNCTRAALKSCPLRLISNNTAPTSRLGISQATSTELTKCAGITSAAKAQ